MSVLQSKRAAEPVRTHEVQRLLEARGTQECLGEGHWRLKIAQQETTIISYNMSSSAMSRAVN